MGDRRRNVRDGIEPFDARVGDIELYSEFFFDKRNQSDCGEGIQDAARLRRRVVVQRVRRLTL